MTGKNYDCNEKVDWLLGIFAGIAENRADMYRLTYEEDTIQKYGTDHFSYEAAAEKVEETINDIRGEDGKDMLVRFAEFTVIESSLFGIKTYRVVSYQTPAYFMQALADLACGTSVHMVASKYESARNAFVVTYASGMKHPHWPETYYLITCGRIDDKRD